MAETVKQEITLAVLGNKMDNLTKKFDVQAVSDKEYKKSMEIRMRKLEDKVMTIETDMTISRRVNRIITMFVGAVAAYLGIRF